MKYLTRIATIIIIAFLFGFFASSCSSSKQYCTGDTVGKKYRSKGKSFNNGYYSYSRSKPINKKWVLKK